MKKIAVVFCVFFSFATVAWSQVAGRVVTNADLERYAQDRQAADREYRETYAAKGLLSPEDLKARNEERVKATIDLANQITAADLEKRRLALEASAQQLQAEQMQYQNAYPVYSQDGGVIWGYGSGFIRNGRFDRRFRGRVFPGGFGRGAYAAGGMVWPAPLDQPRTTRPQPAFRVGGRRH
ncbi:MAG TPA: hypothetical protein VGJ02_03260 [Pyrinomonadaceae bacterium]